MYISVYLKIKDMHILCVCECLGVSAYILSEVFGDIVLLPSLFFLVHNWRWREEGIEPWHAERQP